MLGLGLTTAALMGGNSLAAIIAALFGAGEQGAIWLPEPKYLYQDRAGTTPVTAPGQSVGRRMDVSGRSNYLVAINDAARGVYGVEPFNGRRNLLNNTVFAGAVVPSTPPTGWGSGGIPNIVEISPDGDFGGNSIRLAATESRSFLANAGGSTPVAAGQTITLSSKCEVYSGAILSQMIDISGVTGTKTYTIDGSAALATDIPSAGLHVLTCTLVALASAGAQSRVGIGVASNATGDVRVWSPQIELGPVATPYQRVASQYDVAEAGVPSLHYIQYDGADDGYVSPVITPGTDKAQVFAGVRKLSDAATAIVAELSATTDTNNGAFALFAPSAAGANKYRYFSKSTGNAFADVTSTAFNAPITNVLTGIGDISGDSAILRVNGAQVAQSTADQGAGNYEAYPIYVGRRGGATLPFNGRDYGLITRFGPNLPAPVIAQVERYLAQRTGVSI